MKDNFEVKNEKKVLDEVSDAIKSLGGWGSVEIHVQNNEVTQITTRKIKKINSK